MGSNLNWRKEDISLEVQKRMIIGEITDKKKRSKYNAQRVMRDGYIFHSIKEAEYYDDLKLLREAGEIEYFLCQIPFRLPGRVVYWCDFMTVGKNKEIKYIDVKGYLTDLSRDKIKMTESLYPVKIIIEK